MTFFVLWNVYLRATVSAIHISITVLTSLPTTVPM